jgi:hypothetical protein
MTFSAACGRLLAPLCLMAVLTFGFSPAVAAPRAAELGPEAVMAEPSDGFVGQLRVAPERGPVGTPLTVTGEGFPP